jgi:hypothetical protein
VPQRLLPYSASARWRALRPLQLQHPWRARTSTVRAYGSGSSLQGASNNSIWGPTWTLPANTTRRPGLTNNPAYHYEVTSSGQGLAAFGNQAASSCDSNGAALASQLNPNCDKVAQAASTLDGFIGTDDPPTGPVTTAGTNLADAAQAAGGSVKELTIPVAQAPVSIPFSLPSGITLGTGSKINLKTAVLNDIYAENVPASAHYAANTFGALLELSGLTKVASAPVAQQFTDPGNAGNTGIILQERSSGSGTSYTFKGFLFYAGAAGYTANFEADDNSGPNGWPFASVATACPSVAAGTVQMVQPTGNSSGGGLVKDTASCPGSIGYANLADAANTANGGFTNVAQSSVFGGSPAHDIQYANVQANEGDKTPVYASPALSGTGNKANVYAGSSININGASPTHVGHWFVPLSGTKIVPTGTWGGTNPSDPNVYDHDGKAARYPIVAATYDAAWSNYNASTSNLVGANGYGSLANSNAEGASVKSYLQYVTSATKGQADLVAGGFGISLAPSFYAKLPVKIDGFAVTIANSIVR